VNATVTPTGATRTAVRARMSRAVAVAAGLSLAAAYVHLAYLESHWRSWWAYGAFFLAAGAGQALFAPAILRWPSRALALVGIAGNVAIVGMYIASRTTGVPLGPHAHVPEPAGVIDLSTTAAEVALIAVLMTLLDARTRRWTANALLAIGALLWLMRLTGRLP